MSARGVRLQKILAEAGVASRRGSEKLIVEGRVRVNGEVVTELGTRADPERDRIVVGGRRVRSGGHRVYVLLNKPRGFVSTMNDPAGRPSLADLVVGVEERLFHVGRLDLNSEGLILLTNDGDLAERLSHPRYGCPKTYHAKVSHIPDEACLARLRRGIVFDGKRSAPAEVELLRRTSADGNAWLTITLREGRSRQIRKMMELVGHPVSKLKRVQIGPLRDTGLGRGGWRRLNGREVVALRKAVGGGERVSRGKHAGR